MFSNGWSEETFALLIVLRPKEGQRTSCLGSRERIAGDGWGVCWYSWASRGARVAEARSKKGVVTWPPRCQIWGSAGYKKGDFYFL